MDDAEWSGGGADAARAAWIEDAFDGFDEPVLLLDDRMSPVAWSRRYVTAFFARGDAPRAGEPGLGLVTRMLAGGAVALPPGVSVDTAAERMVAAIRTFVRGFEIPMASGRVLLGTASPTARGGTLVTFRDASRDRMGERRVLELVRDGLESVQMGMLLWDASLVVQMSNRAWRDILGPVEEGQCVREIGLALVRAGLGQRRAGQSAEDFVDATIAAMHSAPRRYESRRADGRRIQLATFPTQGGGVLATAVDVTEQRADEERAKALLSDAVEALEEGVVLCDRDLRLLMYNQAFARMTAPATTPPRLGTLLRDYLGKALAEGRLALPDDVAPGAALESLERAIRGYVRDLEVGLSDGRLIRVSAYATPLGGYLLSIRDITERRRAEQAAREADARTRMIVESLGEGVALYDSEMRLLMNNPAFRRLVMNDLPLTEPGVTLEEEVRRVIAAGTIPVLPGQEDAVIDWILDCIRNHRVGVALPAAGDRVLEASNYATADGGFLILMRDVTERRRAEQATRDADALVRTIVEASPTTFLVSRVEDGKVIYAPPPTRERFGDIQTTLSFFLEPEDRTRYLDALLATGSLTDYPVRFRRRDGSVMDGLTSARVTDWRGEKVIVSSTRDITQQLAMQRELERQREIAHQSEKLSALGELLTGVAHELNNPLSIVVGYALMLEGRVEDPVLARRVRMISVAAERCSRIVRTFLAMARQRPATITRCSINELVETAVEVAGSGLRAAGASIELDLDPDLPSVDADPGQLAQVLSNVLINAEHALASRGPAGRVTVATRTDAARREVVAEITDNGSGVPEALRRRIFEPFFTTKDVGTGTGVGLAFCHRIVTSHGGRIEAGSGPDGGAMFTVRLPAASGDGDGPVDAPVAPRPLGARILVLDDEASIVELAREILEEAGYRVTACTRAEDALRLAAATPFDAIISDIRMPGMDGPAFLRSLAKLAPSQAERAGFLTGDAMGPGVTEYLASCGRPYVEKPVSPDELLDLAARLIQGART